ncbi:MAG: arylsulfatase [Mariniblastus sp.]|nr:arylsulfatase [Mariniblastus sp.]
MEKLLVRYLVLPFILLVVFQGNTPAQENTGEPPNIVVILCDDLGYGDVQPLNPDSKIATPTFSGLARQGMTFTDAHSPSGVCTPTRYGLVCGRYCWRSRLKRGVLGGYSRPLLESDQQTIASVMKSAGYQTACVGKWHLGLGWQWKEAEPENINHFGIAGEPKSVDYSKPLTDTPISHGFDWSYIIPASLDMSPYVYIENDRVTKPVDQVIEGSPFPKFYRKGELAKDFSIIDSLDHLSQKAADYIEEHAGDKQPYFLYVPLPAPHKPVIPTASYQGQSGLGPYGDFIMQVDAAIGKIVRAVDDSGQSDNTLVMVTSDNGSFMYRSDEADFVDHVTDEKVQTYRSDHHTSNGPLRGTKADVWEGGHRVPFLVRWPAQVKAGTRCDATICLVDLLATCAEIGQAPYDQKQSEDSFSLLPNLKNADHSSTRPPVIHHSAGGMFAIRQGKWKLVLGNGSGGRQAPRGKPFAEPYHLYDLSQDLAEQNNVAPSHRDIRDRLVGEFERISHNDHLPSNRNRKLP